MLGVEKPGAVCHGCTVAELKKWNRLQSTRIVTGQKLKVRKS